MLPVAISAEDIVAVGDHCCLDKCCYIMRVWRSPAQYCLQMTMVASSSAFFIATLASLFAARHLSVSVRRCQACPKGRQPFSRFLEMIACAAPADNIRLLHNNTLASVL